MDCNDRANPNHLVGPPTPYPAHVSAGFNCPPPRAPCDTPHTTGPYDVCNDCEAHTRVILHLHAASPFLNAPGQIHPENKNYPVRNLQRIGRGWQAQISPDPTIFATPGAPQLPSVIPPQNAPPAENPPWPGFLARVCSGCERMIRSEQNYRSVHVPTGLPGGLNAQASIVGTPAERREWEHYPRSSCTCPYKLGMLPAPRANSRMCYTHREAQLRELEKKKDENDIWLRNIARRPRMGNTNQLIKADSVTDPNPFGNGRVSRKQTRNSNGNWRACRCGKELDVPYAIAETFICMACEGWVNNAVFFGFTSRFDSSQPATFTGTPYYSEAAVMRFRKDRVKLNREVKNQST